MKWLFNLFKKKGASVKITSFKKTGLTFAAIAAVSSGYIFNDRTEKHLSTLCPAPQQMARCMNEKTPHRFELVQSFRTAEYQKELYAKGRTKPGKKVTWTLNSKHMSGRAFDILVYLESGHHSWKPEYYKIINKEAAEPCSRELDIPYVWGGTFKNKKGQLIGDWGHFETLSCTVKKQKVDI